MKIFTVIAALALLTLPCSPVEAKPPWQGIAEAKLFTPIQEITPGKSFYVGFQLRPQPGYHTYWRGPGVVGVATQLKWSLPEGFKAGEILWPPPHKTDMAGITANGYKKEVILLTHIEVPKSIEAKEITLQVKAAWMACSASCHPSIDSFSLTLPVASGTPKNPDPKLEKQFQELLDSHPQAPPEGWKFSLKAPAKDHIILEGQIPELTETAAESLVFFCDDMQVDSDSPSRFEWVEKSDGHFRLHFVRPDFGPSDPTHFSGILLHRKGWKDLSSPGVEISLPWPVEDPANE